MIFSSISFLYILLPVTLLIYFAVPRGWKNAVLFISSLLFYFYGEPKYTILLLVSSLLGYCHGLYIEKHRESKKAKRALVAAITINLLLLGAFKYADFLIKILNGLLSVDMPLLRWKLPIGISFFTFQTMSYTVDVYRGKVRAEKSMLALATYVCLFPQLVAGPIVRYAHVAKDLRTRKHTIGGFATGVRRFLCGLCKKVLFANTLGQLSGVLLSGEENTVVGLWIGVLAFMLQVYYDFSGYSDMAIGLGRLFGFSFPENFDYPFTAKSLSEFWRRWHMTLGGWFRDYVYIPLGGNRVGRGRWALNLFIVWGLTGLWHGADWNYVLWGLFFGVLLAMEKLFWGRWMESRPAFLRHMYTLLFLILSFAIFNGDAGIGWQAVVSGMLGGRGYAMVMEKTAYYMKSYGVLLVFGIAGATPIVKRLYQRLAENHAGAMALLEPLCCGALLLVATAYLVDGSFNPFLYFRF